MPRWIKGNKTGDAKLKQFMEDYIPINELGKAGLFDKTKIGRFDYEAMAARVCDRLGLESIFDYTKIGSGTRYHISYAIDWNKQRYIPPNVKFVEVLNPVLSPVIGGRMKTGKVLSLF